MKSCTIFAPDGIPEIQAGDDLGRIICDAFIKTPLQNGDILVIAHKIVSKAEGSLIKLASVTASAEAQLLSKGTERDPRHVQVILDESTEILSASANGPLICRHKNGLVCANAAVDHSNSKPGSVIVLPINPDQSAERIRADLQEKLGISLGVIICDTQGRPFRMAACGVAVGISGVLAQKSYVGLPDRAGRIMKSSVECIADEFAAAATIIMGQGDEGRPVAVIRGCADSLGNGSARELIRPEQDDIFLSAMRSNVKQTK